MGCQIVLVWTEASPWRTRCPWSVCLIRRWDGEHTAPITQRSLIISHAILNSVEGLGRLSSYLIIGAALSEARSARTSPLKRCISECPALFWGRQNAPRDHGTQNIAEAKPPFSPPPISAFAAAGKAVDGGWKERQANGDARAESSGQNALKKIGQRCSATITRLQHKGG